MKSVNHIIHKLSHLSIHQLRNLPITQSIDWCKDVPHPYILFSTVIYCYLFHSFLLLTTITTECTLLVYNRQSYCSVWTEKLRTLYNWGICKSVNCVIDRLCDCLIPQCMNWQILQLTDCLIEYLLKKVQVCGFQFRQLQSPHWGLRRYSSVWTHLPMFQTPPKWVFSIPRSSRVFLPVQYKYKALPLLKSSYFLPAQTALNPRITLRLSA